MNNPKINGFAADVLKGLSSEQKHLNSKYFYDDAGSKLFQDIMAMPEYYLTDCEMEIFQQHKESIFRNLRSHKKIELIELGAGDGSKTKVLLSYFAEHRLDFTFIPIDISKKPLLELTTYIHKNIPDVEVQALHGDYFSIIKKLSSNTLEKRVLLFLGSNIGNFENGQAVVFLRQLRENINQADQLLIGFDLKKAPHVIQKAYDDPHGFTAAFNLNLLKRINRELHGNFDLNAFRHIEIYDEANGSARSYLESQCDQYVHIGVVDQSFSFKKDERIYMEISQKYDMEMIEDLANSSGFTVKKNYFDSRNYFVDSLWEVV